MTLRFEQLARQIHGLVILPGDTIYDTARRVWNGMIDRRPRAIVRCADVADVVAAISFARSESLLVAVRGGGHNVAGNAVCDDGLVIDLSGIDEIEIDARRRTALVGGGVVWGKLDAAAQESRLATTGGLVPSTGIAGFTLGGGLGYLMRSLGLACDNLFSAQLVTAAGQVLQVNAVQNPDLFWGIRGGGGNFGVVTSFEFSLHPVGPQIPVCVTGYPLSQAVEALRFYRDFTAEAPDHLGVYANLSCQEQNSPRVGLRGVFNGTSEQGEPALRPMLTRGIPDVAELRSMDYVELQALVEAGFPPGRLNYWKANFLDALGDELIDILVDGIRKAPSRYCYIAIEQMGGAVSRVSKTETAFEHRDAMFSLLILAGWESPADTEANVKWARRLWDRTQPLSTGGVYVNYLGSEGDNRIRAAYGVNHQRLVDLKQRYDPDNFFRLNQNIMPATTSV